MRLEEEAWSSCSGWNWLPGHALNLLPPFLPEA